MSQEWKVLQRKETKYRFFDVVEEQVETFQGHRIGMEYAKVRPGVCVLPIADEGRSVVLLRQYRHVVRSWQWELPAGGLEPGIDPLEMARRELAEETGYTAEVWTPLGDVYPSFGTFDQVIHLFAAERLEAGEQRLEAGEELEVVTVPMERFLAMIASGEFTHGAGLACAARWLARKK